tara:strand:+ start:14663 stop:15820 length:1158 start_codon:yes stop_codon:yes gene_type:complete
MKIAFICGSLEPGHCGVGDYARCLAQECQRQGHTCALIALKDHYLVKQGKSLVVQKQAGIPTARFEDAFSSSSNFYKLQDFLANLDPDWVSLQFVPYSFNPKGLIPTLASKLLKIKGSARLHMMFHEVWIGAYREAPIKEKLMGLLQKYFIKSFLRNCTPKCVHTHTAAYQTLLKSPLVIPKNLPLFSNIQPAHGADLKSLSQKLEPHNIELTEENRNDYWFFGILGTLYPIWEAYPLLSYIDLASQKAGKKPIILSLGNLGPGERLWERTLQQAPKNMRFARLGWTPEDTLAPLINCLDFGIATTPWGLIEKSAAIRPLLESGLPVIVSRDDVHFNTATPLEVLQNPQLVKMTPDLPNILPHLQKQPPHWTLPEVASQFIRDLG